MPPPLIAGWVY